MPLPSEKAWTQVDKGCHLLQLKSWKEFVDFIYDAMLHYESYIWRGHRCDNWRLETTLDRLMTSAGLSGTSDFRKAHLEKFMLAVRGRRGANPSVITDENDWWALGQHHGLATPLLDWTTSPFVAAFFAFSEVGPEQTNNRAIFALHRPTIEKWAKEKRIEEFASRHEHLDEIQATGRVPGLLESAMLKSVPAAEVMFVRPFSDENQRLINQGGLFTRMNVTDSLESWISVNQPDDDSDMTLIKILIPDHDRDVCLRTLNRMNINPLSLFPDLTGASKYCNLFSEVENY